MRFDECLDISVRHGGLRFWRLSDRPDSSLSGPHRAARMFCFRGKADSIWNVEWRRDQWSWVRPLSAEDMDADDWCIEDGPVVDHPRRRLPRSCNRHSDCHAADDRAWPRYTDHCHDDDCEDCFGQ